MELILIIIGFMILNLLVTLFLRAELHWKIEEGIYRGLQYLKSIFTKKFP